MQRIFKVVFASNEIQNLVILFFENYPNLTTLCINTFSQVLKFKESIMAKIEGCVYDLAGKQNRFPNEYSLVCISNIADLQARKRD